MNVGDDTVFEGYSPPPVYTGLCYGGPMHGLRGESRFLRGFVVVDKPNGLYWQYDDAGDTFVCATPDGEAEAYNADIITGIANGVTYDVRALDPLRCLNGGNS